MPTTNLVDIIKSKAPPPDGNYICTIAFARPINDSRRQGVRVTLEVAEGECAGRRADVDFIIDLRGGGREHERARVNRDLKVLTAWCDALGVEGEGIETPIALIMALRQAAVGKRVEFTFKCNDWAGGIQIAVTAVRVLTDG